MRTRRPDELARFFHELAINSHTLDMDTVLAYVEDRRCVVCGLHAYCTDYEKPLCLSTEMFPLERLLRNHQCGEAINRQLRRLRAEAAALEAQVADADVAAHVMELEVIDHHARQRIRFETKPVSDWLPADAYPPAHLARVIHRHWRENWSTWPTIEAAAEAIANEHRVTVTRARQMLAYALDQPDTCLHLSAEWAVVVDDDQHAILDTHWLRWRKVTDRIATFRSEVAGS